MTTLSVEVNLVPVDEIIMLVITPFVTLLVGSLLSLLSCFWLFALALSLAVVSPTEAASIVQAVLVSTFVLRILEAFQSAYAASSSSLLLAMPAANIAMLLAAVSLEIVSIGFRSFSLGFRIFANVAAGHVLADIAAAVRYNSGLGFVTAIAANV